MQAGSPAPDRSVANGAASSGQPHRHRPRRGRGRRDASLSFRPSSVAPERQELPGNASASDPSSGGRGGRRGRGRGGRSNHDRMVNGRQFGGQLTQTDTDTSEQTGQTRTLQADAAVFVPGQPGATDQPAPPPKTQRQARQQKRRMSKSQAPDIATRTHEDIDNGHYECPICTSEVRRNSKIWSCHTCWTVFHLTCVKKWAANEGSAFARRHAEDGDIPPPRQWRCPGCNLPKDDLPKSYTCWCGKEQEPRSPAGLPPHSCGNTCSNERAKKCPHPCSLTCHAGPCPPCEHTGPTQVCFCGKHEITNRCSETNYETGWSCGEVCGEVLPCGEHTCARVCHEGLCGGCEERVSARCYCGQVDKDILCEDRGEQQQCYNTHKTDGADSIVENWTGEFNCENPCGHDFDCYKHKCEEQCHRHGLELDHCPRSPDVVSHCPCGKTKLVELTESQRKSCNDPIPNCSKSCNKLLPCGHQCQAVCHSGQCPSCSKIVDISCRCGRTISKSVCHQGQEEPPHCMRVCRAGLSCGRHNCDERCCPGERKAIERQSTKRKQRPLNSAPRAIGDDFEAEHICTRQCGRLLKCGIHHDQDLCHRGPCGTCREAIFEEVSCHCGRTVLQPPLPCGTKPPPCRFPCNRTKECGHAHVAHNCHQDDEACPKCPFLVEKRCMCGKKSLKNQPCFLKDVSCGMVCEQKLSCGSHLCQKQCHRPGQCEDATGECKQLCAKEKKICGHKDLENTCHAPFPCPEDKSCTSKIFMTCACQAQKQEIKCSASKSSEGNGGKTLPCTEECARLERNRRLALALDIDQSSHVDGLDHIPYSTETLNLFAPHVKWGQDQEREFRVFATSPEEKRLRFKPMKAHQRAFVHSLAEDFGLDSESMDPEPHRHVMIWKTPRFVAPPNKTLAEALRIRQAQRSATGSTNVSDNEGLRPPKSTSAPREPYDAFVISNPRFGLTVDELRAELSHQIHPSMGITFDIEFLPSEEVLLKASSPNTKPENLQKTLQSMKTQVVAAISLKGFGSPELCATDSSLNILHRESDHAGTDGWSKVAAKKAAPKTAAWNGAASTAGNNSFSALGGGGGNKVTFTAKKKPEAAKTKPTREKERTLVVDDWEAAETAEEERERVVISGDEEGAAFASGDRGDRAQALKEPDDVEAASRTSQAGIGEDSQSAMDRGEERRAESEQTKD